MPILDQYLENISVIGAAGKMGKGISLLLLKELLKENKTPTLNLIDPDPHRIKELKTYLKYQLEKQSIKSNIDPQPLLKKADTILNLSTNLEEIKNSTLIFEAVPEILELKKSIYKKINHICIKKPYFFTNTSSIPISVLNEECNLNDRVIGFHFYNPPPIQKLLEIIPTKNKSKELLEIANELGTLLNKTMVYASDTAGFIGNGHFLREVFNSCKKVTELTPQYGLGPSIYIVNKIFQDFLIRPMGIFQLIDYVGLDICNQIGTVMNRYIPNELFCHPLISMFLERGVKGGQNGSGAQENGIFQYQSNKPIGILSDNLSKYSPLNEKWNKNNNTIIGTLPPNHHSWKELVQSLKKEKQLTTYFNSLKKEKTLGAKLAIELMEYSRSIANQLIEQGVSQDSKSINTVLMSGFYHLYGPIHSY
jgi:3-hydroxyacyl-CoA dehydrogenase